MKFLHFYEALSKVCGPSNKPIHSVSKRNESSKTNTSLLKEKSRGDDERNRIRNKQSFKVESGFVCYKPIDSTARRVISPASWIHKPNAIMPEHINQSVVNDGERYISGTDVPLPKSFIDPKTGKRVVDAVAANEVIAIAEKQKALEKTKSIELQIAQARASVMEIASGLSIAIDDMELASNRAIESVRNVRMAAVTETHQILTPLKDIRKFFHGSEHIVEVERLKEFVDLCERLERLKKNGTLDAVSDTIIKLSLS